MKVQTLTVRDLVQALLKMDPADPVYLSRDEEGNGYGPLFKVEAVLLEVDDTGDEIPVTLLVPLG